MPPRKAGEESAPVQASALPRTRQTGPDRFERELSKRSRRPGMGLDHRADSLKRAEADIFSIQAVLGGADVAAADHGLSTA
jgi:hypothetical protein